jgi:alpha-L-fucosidase
MPAWFNEAKIGIFVVWGPYSVPGWAPKGQYAEWYGQRVASNNEAFRAYHDRVWGADVDYDTFARKFTADAFDPNAWADLFARAGARYVVTVSNYHDGFAMYPTSYGISKYSDRWNAMDMGPRRDVLGELNAAGRRRGLRMGIYYSLYEWWHPLTLAGEVDRFVAEHLHPKFKEVVTRYRPPVIFLDGEWSHPYQTWRSEELAAWLYNESPVKDEVVVNDRWGQVRSRYGDYFSSEYGGGNYPPTHPWQEDRGIGHSYGYNRNEDIEDYNTRGELLRLLCRVAANGGNLLLDVGPTGDGRIPPIMQERLLQMGQWLAQYGEAIYGSQASPFWPRRFAWGECTVRDNRLYLHLFDATRKAVTLSGMASGIRQAVLLPDRTPLALERTENGWRILLPEHKPDPDVSVIALDLEGPLQVDTRPIQDEKGEIRIPASAFDTEGKTARMEYNGYHRVAHIDHWTNPEETLRTSFTLVEPGSYGVAVTYTGDRQASGSRATVRIGEQSLSLVSEDTGGWTGRHYRSVTIGRVALLKRGPTPIALVPDQADWKRIAIKEIRLTPVPTERQP